MACQPVDSVVAEHKSGPRSITARWVYSGDAHLGFVVTIWRKYADPIGWLVAREVHVVADVREFAFTQLHIGAEQEWKASVRTFCKDCTLEEAVDSPSIIIPPCVPLDFVAGWAMSWAGGIWVADIIKGELDQPCPTDKLYCEHDHPTAPTEFAYKTRAEWTSTNGAYRSTFAEAVPESGTHRWRFKKQTDEGTESGWSAYYDVIIP